MGERTTGTLIGGIVAILGSIIGFWAYIVMGAFDLSTLLSPLGIFPVLFLLMSILAIIFAIMLTVGYMMKWSSILLLIFGIISLLVSILVLASPAGLWAFIAAGLEILGAVIAMATGALT
ncbi:MAG: hypothetical protein ACETWM_06935 [Candidatus Lokiarchaeia archaeon]